MPRLAATSVDIDAPIEAVWSVMTDFARYPEWNPFVVAIQLLDGELRQGSTLGLHVRWAGGGEEHTVEQVTRLEPPSGSGMRRATMEYRFTGWLVRLGLVRGSRMQMIEQPARGATTYRTSELFHGWLAAAVPLAKVQQGFELHARALKRRTELLVR
jgi:uncharacterized protein YndB with AHSA1/START domain